MNGSMNSLSASITSALALKPSTVYILRVENRKAKQSWHIRRCFSEFCELREKLLSLIDDQMAIYLTSLEVDSTECSLNTTSSSTSSGATTCTSINSYRGIHLHHSSGPKSNRFTFMFKQFPPRKLFGSRSKRVIETRSLALNSFLQQALEVVEVVRQRQMIAVCFSMMNHIETFLDCGAHREVARVAPSSTSSIASRSDRSTRRETMSPSAERRTSAAVSLTPGFHHYPLVPTPAFTMTITDDRYQASASRYNRRSSSDEDDGSSEDEAQQFNNLGFAQRFYREFGRQDERAEETYDDDSDEDEEMQNLKKTWSAMMESEMRERKLHHSGSHFSMLEGGQSPADWARRIEIAGIRKADGKLSAVPPTRKPSEPETAKPGQLLHRHRSNYRIPVKNPSTCA